MVRKPRARIRQRNGTGSRGWTQDCRGPGLAEGCQTSPQLTLAGRRRCNAEAHDLEGAGHDTTRADATSALVTKTNPGTHGNNALGGSEVAIGASMRDPVIETGNDLPPLY